MSVLYVEGFETSADQPDVVGRGLLSATSPVSVAGIGVVPVPSRTGVVGTGLLLRGPYGSSNALPNSSAGVSDFGMLPINQSVYSLWQAGGFALGVNASFNSLNVLQIAPGDTGQLIYDGSVNYWAIAYNGSAYVVAYSTDLKNWTVTATQPTGINVNSCITVNGSGSSATIIVSSHGRSAATNTPYYSTNLGSTWTAMSISGAASVFAVTPVTGVTGVAYFGVAYSSGWKVCTYASITAAPTLLAVSIGGGGSYNGSYLKVSNGYLMAMGYAASGASTVPSSGVPVLLGWCALSNSPTTAANWTIPAQTTVQLNDVVWFNNLAVAVGYSGVWVAGAATSNLWTQEYNAGTSVIWSIASNGTLLVAVGQDPTNTWEGAIYTSTNGTLWTKANRFLLNSAVVTNGNQFSTVYWDGTRFIVSGGLSNNMVITSTDGFAWNALTATEFAEATGTSCASFLGVFSGQQNLASGIFTPWGTAAGNVCGVGVVAAAAASNLRTVTGVTVTAGAFLATTQTASLQSLAATVGLVPPSTLCHYYEFIFTAVPGTVNLFNVAWAIDNNVLGNLGQFQMASNTDTTGLAQLYFNLPRTGNFTQIDDIYLTNFTGPYHNNRLGVQRIYPFAPNSDVTDNFTTSIGGATNNKTVNSTLSNSEGYISSSATTAQDIYGTTNSVPTTGTVVNAVQVEGFMTALGQSAGGGAVGLQSNGVQKLGTPIATNVAPTRAQLIQETDPNTNVPWTIAGLNAVDIVVAKTS